MTFSRGQGRVGPWAAGVVGALWALGAAAQAVPTADSDTAGAIAGRVCLDVDGDGACGTDEPGIAGARVVLETGQQAITDAQGRYHLAAIDARAPSTLRGLHLQAGRHRLKLDLRSLSPTSRIRASAFTVEVPLSGMVLQDFAVTVEAAQASPVQNAPAELPPSGRLEAGQKVRFNLTGQAGPGDQVEVQGAPARVDAAGGFTASDLLLAPGGNEVAISATSPSGAVRFLRQHVDVIARQEGVLVVPRQVRSVATVQVPAVAGHPAATGPSALTVTAPAGTRVTHQERELTVGSAGVVQVPVELRAGANKLELRVQAPGRHPDVIQVDVDAEPRAFVVGLLDLEGGFNFGGTASLYGRGGVHAEVPLGAWQLSGELELRDQDLADVKAAGALALLGLREPQRLERALDPERFPTEWGDDSASVTPNPGQARLRLELSNMTWGKVGLGTHRAQFAEGEVGRYQRELFGPFLDLHTPAGPFQVQARAFAAPGWVDPVDGIATVPAHEELSATGGSVYYLGHQDLAEGSEVVRVEIRDGLGGAPLAERHLVRGRDYEVNYPMGRILLAEPLSFVTGASVLAAQPLTSNPQQVLVVEYEHEQLGAPGRPLGGGELTGTLGPVHLTAGAVDEAGPDPYTLFRARGSVPVGPLELSGEYAHSAGSAIAPGNFGISDDGGLSFLNPTLLSPSLRSGDAWGVRLKGPGWGEDGFIDASYRARSAGFSDSAHTDLVNFHQGFLRAQQRLGPFVVGALVDDQVGPDPRDPFGTGFVAQRTFGASIGYRTAIWELRLEGRDAQLTAAMDPTLPVPALQTGGRTTAGVFGRYRLTPWLALVASHNQSLVERGSGPGAFDTTFASVGAEVSPKPGATVGIRGGWGPSLGPLAWVDGRVQQGAETHYGSYSVDVDGPDVGQRRMINGVRTEVGDRSAVFVEDVAAHDATSIRMSRAVGITEGLADGLEVTGRYERGVRDPLDILAPLSRDAAGASATFIRKRVRLFARGEYRFERGQTVLGPPVDVHRTQWLVSAGVHVDLLEHLTASGRLNASQTVNLGQLEARFVDANAGLTWRAGPLIAVLHYGLTRNLPPPSANSPFQGELVLHTLSLLPAFHVGDRVTVSAGANLGWSSLAGTNALVLSASVRPSVRVVGGLELAAEVARRSSAVGGGELAAVRAEAGYRVGDQFLMALGFTVLGYSGLGVDPTAQQNDRVYLRGELAY